MSTNRVSSTRTGTTGPGTPSVPGHTGVCGRATAAPGTTYRTGTTSPAAVCATSTRRPSDPDSSPPLWEGSSPTRAPFTSRPTPCPDDPRGAWGSTGWSAGPRPRPGLPRRRARPPRVASPVTPVSDPCRRAPRPFSVCLFATNRVYLFNPTSDLSLGSRHPHSSVPLHAGQGGRRERSEGRKSVLLEERSRSYRRNYLQSGT